MKKSISIILVVFAMWASYATAQTLNPNFSMTMCKTSTEARFNCTAIAGTATDTWQLFESATNTIPNNPSMTQVGASANFTKPSPSLYVWIRHTVTSADQSAVATYTKLINTSMMDMCGTHSPLGK